MRVMLHVTLVAWLLGVSHVQTAFAQSASADASTSALSGVVRDATGGVIAGAIVSVRALGASFERFAETTRDGTFRFAGVSGGRYIVSIVAPGFSTAMLDVTLPSDDQQELVLTPAAVVEQVVVQSASRQEELRETLNTRVDVVTRSRMEDTGAETVAEVLREVPGVVTRRGSETSRDVGTQIQGIDSRQVLVLIDGLPLVGARGIKRGAVNLDRQSTARLERVEVVKGAASTLYGSDAIGGVINLITRDASGPFEVGATLSGGSFGEFNARGETGMKRGPWSGLFSVERHQHDGFDLTPTTPDTTGAPYRRTDGFAKVNGQVSTSLSLTALANGYGNRARGRSIGELGPQEDDVRERTLNAGVSANWLMRPTTAVQARGYYAGYDEDSSASLTAGGTPLEPGRLDERLTRADATLSQTLGTEHMLQGGVEFTRDEYAGLNRLRHDDGEDVSTDVVWAQHRATFGRVTTTAGARVDWHSIFGSAVSPKLAANYHVAKDIYVRGSYGRGFRAPDIGQLYYRFLNPSSLYQVIGNPGLQPEYAHSWQFGGEAVLHNRRARVGLNFYRNDVEDLIESTNLGFVATPAQLTELLEREGLDASFRPVLNRLFFTYKNVSDAVTQGVEVDSEVALRSDLSLAAAYTYLDARDQRTDLELTQRSRHHGHVRLAWQLDRIGLRANVRATLFSSWIASRVTVNGVAQDTRADGFALWDAYVSQRIVRGLTAFATVENIGDSQDPAVGQVRPDGTPLPVYRFEAGRAARFGLRWSWAAR